MTIQCFYCPEKTHLRYFRKRPLCAIHYQKALDDRIMFWGEYIAGLLFCFFMLGLPLFLMCLICGVFWFFIASEIIFVIFFTYVKFDSRKYKESKEEYRESKEEYI